MPVSSTPRPLGPVPYEGAVELSEDPRTGKTKGRFSGPFTYWLQQLQTFFKPTGLAQGTYTLGAKLTPDGQNGTITIDANGRVTAIQQAT